MIHAILNKALDFGKIAAESAEDRSPGHALLDLARETAVKIYVPHGGLAPTRGDRMRSRLFSRPQLWALAREVVAAAGPEDVIFCTGEDVGIPVATRVMQRMRGAGGMRAGVPRVAMFVHNLARPRARAAMCLFGCAPAITHWLTNAHPQAHFVSRTLGIPLEEIAFIPEQTDSRFFRPAEEECERPESRAARRPLIVSVGLEQRDYRTLAAATGDLAVDVRISGFSTDARAMTDAFPDALPANMTRAFYGWTELRALYRTADVVVVPLFENPYCAGLTSLLEGMACRKPVIISRTQGVDQHLLYDRANDPGRAGGGAGEVCLTVAPGDATALRDAIGLLLSDAGVAQRLASAGHQYLRANHTPAHWLAAMLNVLAVDPRLAPAGGRAGRPASFLRRVSYQFRGVRLPSPVANHV